MKSELFLFLMALQALGCSSDQNIERQPLPANQNQSEENQQRQNQQKDTDSRFDADATPSIDNADQTPTDCNYKFRAETSGPIDTSGKAAVPIFGNVSFSLKASAEVDVIGSDTQGSIALDADIESFSPSFARSLADNIISSYKDPLTLVYATGKEREEIFSQSAWRDLDCLVLPVKAIRNNSYEYRYEPAIPFLINGNASTEDIAAISSRRFPNIKAQIIRHPTARAGSHQGSAEVSSRGNTVTVTFDFGGSAPRANSTPIKSVAYTLDGQGGYSSTKMSAFVSDHSLIDLDVGN